MLVLVQSATVICFLFLFEKARNKKEGFLYYLIIFLVLSLSTFLMNLLFPSKAHASEIDYETFDVEFYREDWNGLSSHFIPDAQTEILFLQKGFQAELTATQKKYYKDKVSFHKKEGDRYYKEAKKMCWYLPDLEARERAKDCFTSVMAGLAAADLKSKAIVMLISMLTKYGLDCIDEWNVINTKLRWSEYHYEMQEFYKEVLDKA